MITSMKFDDVTLRRRFHELRAEIAAIEAKSGPLRARRDAEEAKDAPSRKLQATLAEQFLEIEAPLYDLKQELAAIARALKGKTGNPDGTMPEPAAPANEAA